MGTNFNRYRILESNLMVVKSWELVFSTYYQIVISNFDCYRIVTPSYNNLIPVSQCLELFIF